jgi:carbon storage regulator
MIGDDVEVMIVRVNGGKVRLGIRAQKSISVHRLEIYDEIQAKKSAKADNPLFPFQSPKEFSPLGGQSGVHLNRKNSD